MRSIKVFLCTRDRPAAVKCCISGLRSALHNAYPEMLADCYIFDDATSIQVSDTLQQMATNESSSDFKLHVICCNDQEKLIARLGDIDSDCRQLLDSSFKQLGVGSWDLAGVRNLAFLYAYAMSSKDDLLLFLDDDMLFEDTIYRGYSIPLDGAAIIRQLCEFTPPDRVIVSGAGCWGQADLTIVEHVESLYRSLVSNHQIAGDAARSLGRLEGIAQFPATLPTKMNLPGDTVKVIPANPGPRGISGAVMATTPRTLLSHGLMRCYNEDWIWLLLLGKPSARIRRVPLRVIHAAPTQGPVTVDFIVYQQVGEILFRALEEVVGQAPADCDLASWCMNHVDVQRFATAKGAVAREMSVCIETVRTAESFVNDAHLDALSMDISAAKHAICSTLDYLGRALDLVNMENPEELAGAIIRYLDSVPMWRRLLPAVRAELGRQAVR